ncbi:unnamed protein product [Lampetra planeri]
MSPLPARWLALSATCGGLRLARKLSGFSPRPPSVVLSQRIKINFPSCLSLQVAERQAPSSRRLIVPHGREVATSPEPDSLERGHRPPHRAGAVCLQDGVRRRASRSFGSLSHRRRLSDSLVYDKTARLGPIGQGE